MTWLDRLRSIEKSLHCEDPELPKLSKGAFGSFDSAHPKDRKVFSPAASVPRTAMTWEASDWREYFDERVAVAMIEGQQPEAEARRIAWACCVTRWRDLHPVASEPEHCAHCGRPDEPGNIVPFGAGPHAWLHSGCWPAWDRERQEKARRALAGLLPSYKDGGRQ